MKIVTWNCNGAFRKKHEALDEFDADLLVIQECEDPNQSTKNFAEWSGGYLWTGKSKNKGLGVFPRKSSKLEKLDWPDENLEQFLPCRVNDSFNLLAVWTKQADSTTFQYIGQFWKYLQLNKESISGPKTVICGDFNSNSCWDKRGRHWNHSDVVRELEELGILSMYHEMSGVDQGKEEVPTIFHMKNKEKPYHIDYAFVSSPLMHAGNLDVGHPDQWLEFSDHMPVVFHLPDLGGSDHRPSNVTRDLLRKKVWEVLPKYENEYSLDEEIQAPIIHQAQS